MGTMTKNPGLSGNEVTFLNDVYESLFLFFNRNPTPGLIINHPNGSDVYAGVVKDYVGDVSSCNTFCVRYSLL